MTVRFLRVLGQSAKRPAVVAIADGHLVKWHPKPGWTCDCETEGDTCPHSEAVADLLDDKVTGEAQ